MFYNKCYEFYCQVLGIVFYSFARACTERNENFKVAKCNIINATNFIFKFWVLYSIVLPVHVPREMKISK